MNECCAVVYSDVDVDGMMAGIASKNALSNLAAHILGKLGCVAWRA
jgi:phosphoribosylformimino-5-aminoimidazole carboxamide ribonucleotide (ProFAR) isomerase